jgi:diacylglycerol kinase (ATP)
MSQAYNFRKEGITSITLYYYITKKIFAADFLNIFRKNCYTIIRAYKQNTVCAPESRKEKAGKSMFSHLKKAFGYSMAGFSVAIREEVAVRLVIAQAVAVFAAALSLPLSYPERAALLFSALFCVSVELLNSGMENIVDLVTPEWHILAKKAKDMGSAAQFVALASLYAQILLIVASRLQSPL